MIKYLTFSLSIAFISWIVGMLITALLSKTNLYNNRLSRLNFIPDEKFNELIGLSLFKWIIMNSFFKYFNPKLSIRKQIVVGELQAYRSEMTKAELGHNFAFLFMTVFVLMKVFQGLHIFVLVMLVVNILMNLYPSLLQQQNKRRIDRYLRAINQRTKTFFLS